MYEELNKKSNINGIIYTLILVKTYSGFAIKLSIYSIINNPQSERFS